MPIEKSGAFMATADLIAGFYGMDSDLAANPALLSFKKKHRHGGGRPLRFLESH